MKIKKVEVSFEIGTDLKNAKKEAILNSLQHKCVTTFSFNDDTYVTDYNEILDSCDKSKVVRSDIRWTKQDYLTQEILS